jgi:hypothetical protein
MRPWWWRGWTWWGWRGGGGGEDGMVRWVITEGGVPLGRPTGGGGRTRTAVGGSGGGAYRGAWGHLPSWPTPPRAARAVRLVKLRGGLPSPPSRPLVGGGGGGGGAAAMRRQRARRPSDPGILSSPWRPCRKCLNLESFRGCSGICVLTSAVSEAAARSERWSRRACDWPRAAACGAVRPGG